MAKIIKFSASTGYSGSKVTDECEVPEGWDDLSEDEKEKFMENVASDFISNNVDINVWIDGE